MVEGARGINYGRRMSLTLEQRVDELEKQVTALTEKVNNLPRQKDWRRTIGIFHDDPTFDEVVRLGREYREQQTYEKEVAAMREESRRADAARLQALPGPENPTG